MLSFSSSPSPHSVGHWQPVCCTTQSAVIRSQQHPTTRRIINTASTATHYTSRTKSSDVGVVKVEGTARCVHALGGLLHRLLWLSASRGITVDSSALFDEAVHLSPLDVNLDSRVNRRMIRLRLKQSKTYLFRRGADVFLGRTYHDICSVSALLAHLVQWGRDRGPLFTYSDGSSLFHQKLVSKVHSALATEGLDSNGFNGQSFVIGAATTAKAKESQTQQ